MQRCYYLCCKKRIHLCFSHSSVHFLLFLATAVAAAAAAGRRWIMWLYARRQLKSSIVSFILYANPSRKPFILKRMTTLVPQWPLFHLCCAVVLYIPLPPRIKELSHRILPFITNQIGGVLYVSFLLSKNNCWLLIDLFTFGEWSHIADDTFGIRSGNVEPLWSVGQVLVLDCKVLGENSSVQHAVSEGTEEHVVLVLIPEWRKYWMNVYNCGLRLKLLYWLLRY